MACNNAKQPPVSGLVDPTSQSKNAGSPVKRRFCGVKSVPLAEFLPSGFMGNGARQNSEIISSLLPLSIRKVAIILSIYLGLGTVCFYALRDDIGGKKSNPIIDSLYFSIITMTTVGYGDLVPDAGFVKILACLFAFIGVALFGLIMSKAADYLIEKQEILLAKALNKRDKLDPSAMKEIEASRSKFKCLIALAILCGLILVGTIFLYTIERMNIIDALYCVCSTITTLGYGDDSFSSGPGRFFAVFWVMACTVGVAQIFLYIAELLTENRQKALVKWVLSRWTTYVDLEAADIDDDGIVGSAEFALYKLKEMGKISQEDIHLVMEEFRTLDVGQSGTLSLSGLPLNQASPTKR